MKNLKVAMFGVIGLLGLAGCSSVPDAGERHAKLERAKYEREAEIREETLESIPDWFLEPALSDEAGFYAVGMGQSVDLMSAIRMAELTTQMKLAGNVSQLIVAQEKVYNKSLGTQAGKILETTLNSFINEMDVAGTEFDRKEVKVIGVEYVVYMRGYLPVKSLKAAQMEAKFAEDLALGHADADAEMMERVNRVKAEAIRQEKLEVARKQAEADERATRVAQAEMLNRQISEDQ